MTWEHTKLGFDATEYFQERLQIQKHMGHYLAPCPIHGGQGLTLKLHNGEFSCMVCGAFGDPLDFEMRSTKASKEEAESRLEEWQKARNRERAEYIRSGQFEKDELEKKREGWRKDRKNRS